LIDRKVVPDVFVLQKLTKSYGFLSFYFEQASTIVNVFALKIPGKYLAKNLTIIILREFGYRSVPLSPIKFIFMSKSKNGAIKKLDLSFKK